jgi:hypothetical protein
MGWVAASGEKMLLDTIATIILAGMMLIPFVNIIVGVIVGAGLAGVPGALLGLAVAIAVTGVERLAAEHRQALRPAAADAEPGVSAPPERTVQAPLRTRLRVRVLARRRRVGPAGVHATHIAAPTLH